MNNTKAAHTPGPWRVGGVDGQIWIERPNKNDACICDVIQSALDGSEPYYASEDKENARLIAAAPDMLAALMRVHVFLRNGIALGYIRMPDPELNDPAGATPEIVRAAIKSATGSEA